MFRSLIHTWFSAVLFVKREWRRQPLWLVGISLVLLLAVVSVVRFFHLKMDQHLSVARTEESWTYLVFGLASVFGFCFSILILMNQRRKEFGDSLELLQHLIEIVADASMHGSRLSILYPSPNPGQWDCLFHGRKAFERFRKAVLERSPNRLETQICLLQGNAKDENSALGQFVKAFHAARFVKGELVAMPDSTAGPLAIYQHAVDDFFGDLKSTFSGTIKYIHNDWLQSILKNQLVILATGHSLGFVGYMSLEAGEYRFKALPLSGSTGFLHGLFDALASFYERPPATPADKGNAPLLQLAERIDNGT